MDNNNSKNNNNSDDSDSWDQITYRSCVRFCPRFERGKVVKVYDGDSVTIGTLDRTRHSCRLIGIDTAEIRARTPAERAAAYASRDVLRACAMGRVMDVAIGGHDKYGRLLVRLVDREHGDLSALMLARGGAVPYAGGRKADVDWAREAKKIDLNLSKKH